MTNLPEPLFHCSFGKNCWEPDEWIMVKSPRWDYFGSWIQRDSYIENQTPAGVEPIKLESEHAAETYTSMVLKRQFSRPVTIIATMSFTSRMAPLMVISKKLGADKDSRAEYREHYEIVIYDRGINIWHHRFIDGKACWQRIACNRFRLDANIPYQVKVAISQEAKDKTLSVSVAGHELGYIDDSLPEEFYVGITGCEGINRFYDFRVDGA